MNSEFAGKLRDGVYAEAFTMLQQMQHSIRNVSQIFQKSYPVTIVQDNFFHIFDTHAGEEEYKYILSEPCPYPLPKGVRAAFPLECYDDRMSAIVTDDVFGSREEYVMILHEFVHCAQFNACELELKASLNIAREYRIKNDYMWEINHPFPYNNPEFADLFASYMDALRQQDYGKVLDLRKQFESILSKNDREYMLWQEWKEGFARYIENRIKNLLDIKENHYGFEQPYSRVSFYESGSLLISLIEQERPDVINNFKELFFEMRGR